MTTEQEVKPREFWVDPESMDDEVGIYDTFDKHPGQGPLQWQASLIHVIEKSAYQKAVDALKEACDELYIISCATRFDGDRIQAANADAAKRSVIVLRETLKELGEL